jgi:BirA family biotin operon repressor/biotin-[acetyl-CoA-carboxylase] ligase
MKSPVSGSDWLILDSTTSTQDDAAKALLAGSKVGLVLAREQVSGRGRFRREWHSPPDDSLSVSFIFRDYADWPKPHLIGMSVAVAAATALGGNVQWPNDLMLNKRKLGGILTEMVADTAGRMVPIVGIGVNLNQTLFPEEIAHRATSLKQRDGNRHDPVEVCNRIIAQFASLPEPKDWPDLEPHWHAVDATRGKRYVTGEGIEVIASKVGPQGELIGLADGKEVSVLAADALFG